MEEKYEIDVQLDKKTLDHFLIRNNFLRAGGVAGFLIKFFAVFGVIVDQFCGYFGTDCILEGICHLPACDPGVFRSYVYHYPACGYFTERQKPVKKRGIPQAVSLYFFRGRNPGEKHCGNRTGAVAADPESDRYPRGDVHLYEFRVSAHYTCA